MKMHIFNKVHSMEPRYHRVTDNVESGMIPRVGDHVNIGYNPAPVVTDVLWDYDTNEVMVVVE